MTIYKAKDFNINCNRELPKSSFAGVDSSIEGLSIKSGIALRQVNEYPICTCLLNVSTRGAIHGMNMGQEMLIGDLATKLG